MIWSHLVNFIQEKLICFEKTTTVSEAFTAFQEKICLRNNITIDYLFGNIFLQCSFVYLTSFMQHPFTNVSTTVMELRCSGLVNGGNILTAKKFFYKNEEFE